MERIEEDNKRMSIPEFVGNLGRHPLLIPNKYEVSILGPNGIFPREVMYNCITAAIPARTLSTVERHIHGPQTKVPYLEIFDDLSFTFRLSADMYERALIDEWMTKVGGRKYGAQYYYDIIGEIRVAIMHRNDQKTRKYTFLEAFPISLSETGLSQDASEPAAVTIQFAYHHYEWE